jgi:hypothetical protein
LNEREWKENGKEEKIRKRSGTTRQEHIYCELAGLQRPRRVGAQRDRSCRKLHYIPTSLSPSVFRSVHFASPLDIDKMYGSVMSWNFLKYTTYSPSLPSHLSNLGLSMPLNREPLSIVLGSLHDCRAYQVYVSAYFSVECAWVPRRRNASLVFNALLLFGLTRTQYST